MGFNDNRLFPLSLDYSSGFIYSISCGKCEKNFLFNTKSLIFLRNQLLSQVQGLILVYSVTSKQSADQLFQLREKVLNLKGVSSLPSILLATKTDLPEKTHQVSDKEGRDFSDRFGCCFFSQISLLNETENEKNLQFALSLLNQEIKKSKTSVMEEIKELEPAGSLNKTSKNLKKFKAKTYFIRDGILYCGQNDNQITPKTSKIPLSEDTVVEIIATDPSKKIFAFEVRNASGKMFISATNEEDRNYWIDSIICNVACSVLAASLIEDVVRVTLWDVLSDPELTKSDSLDSLVLIILISFILLFYFLFFYFFYFFYYIFFLPFFEIIY